MYVADSVALDDALVVYGDKELYFVHISVRGHCQDIAFLALIDIRYLGVGAGVFDLLKFSAARHEVGDHVIQFFFGV